MTELRRYFVLREVETPVEEIRKGDVFRMEPLSYTHHTHSPYSYQLATSDAERVGARDSEDYTTKIRSIHVSLVESLTPTRPRPE